MENQENIKAYILTKGTLLKDRYVIQSVLGEGGFGITYLAFDTLLNSRVAVKEFFISTAMLRDPSTNDIKLPDDEQLLKKIETAKKSFINEINVMKALNNIPYISRLRDSFEENKTYYIVMNLLKGQTLQDYIKKHKHTIKTKELLPSIKHILIALEKIHENGFIHRDISPGNLFLTDDGDLYLIDFGCSMKIDGNSSSENSLFFEHLGFHAPEYNDIPAQGPWTDIYSLCATAYYLLTKTAVPSVEERKIYDSVPQTLTKYSLTVKQQNTLIGGLHPDISRRIKNARQLYDGLFGDYESPISTTGVSYAAFTNIGTRKLNQDNLLVDGLFYYEGTDFIKDGTISFDDDTLHLVAVCDGVSRSNSGELASRAAAQALRHFINQYRNSDTLPEILIEEFLDQLNEKIISLGNKIGQTASTVSLLLWKEDQFYAANIGDSPIYLLRKRRLINISEHHTLFSAKIMKGIPANLSDRHSLVNYLGKQNVAGSQIASYHHGYLKKGDTFILCSDGVTNRIPLDKLTRYISKSPAVAIEKINKIISSTINNDNSTAVILRYM